MSVSSINISSHLVEKGGGGVDGRLGQPLHVVDHVLSGGHQPGRRVPLVEIVVDWLGDRRHG